MQVPVATERERRVGDDGENALTDQILGRGEETGRRRSGVRHDQVDGPPADTTRGVERVDPSLAPLLASEYVDAPTPVRSVMNPTLTDVGVTPGALAVFAPPDNVPPVDPGGEVVELAEGLVLLDELPHAASTVTKPRTTAPVRTDASLFPPSQFPTSRDRLCWSTSHRSPYVARRMVIIPPSMSRQAACVRITQGSKTSYQSPINRSLIAPEQWVVQV